MGCHLSLGSHAEIDFFESHDWLNQASKGQKTLVCVPGVVSCALEAKVDSGKHFGCGIPLGRSQDWQNVFISTEELATGVVQFRNVLKLRKTKAKRADGSEVVSTRNLDGVQIRPYPGVEGIATLNPGEDPIEIPVWKRFIEMMAPKYRLRAASYDWRRWGDVVFMEQHTQEFRRTIEQEVKLTGQTVAVVGHSMGANVILYCMSLLGDEWCKNHVSEIFLVGPAVAGSAAMLSGFANAPLSSAVGVNLPDFLDSFVAEMATTFPAMAALMPTQVGDVEAHDVDHKFVVTPDRSYGVEDMGQFVADMKREWPDRVHTADFWPFITEEARRISAPAVPTHMVYLDHLDTPCQVTYESNDLRQEPFVSRHTAGDGTIMASGVQALAAAWGRDGKAPVELHRMPGDVDPGRRVDHAAMISEEWLVRLIEGLVPAQAEPDAPSE
eukprot:CAMPEP_0198512490 /NCGR_PEP_ID=MMETSP1462-20131121/15477_1 /TAXON_ID=1333877 /ORGANISM="Brandtodinium nutriculum, Strain RCC3387" /LENGTH=439 /DNA_ID=CAMNT_0044241897 /DNA_START=9 /DNA_END=1325 /DNA_ORIENTATION=+